MCLSADLRCGGKIFTENQRFFVILDAGGQTPPVPQAMASLSTALALGFCCSGTISLDGVSAAPASPSGRPEGDRVAAAVLASIVNPNSRSHA